MTQEDKNLLLKDLCARLLYGVKVTWDGLHSITIIPSIYNEIWKENRSQNIPKPYLRPMSSMTEEEVDEFTQFDVYSESEYIMPNYDVIDWLNAHHFDFRNLIGKGLAIEAPDDMYK